MIERNLSYPYAHLSLPNQKRKRERERDMAKAPRSEVKKGSNESKAKSRSSASQHYKPGKDGKVVKVAKASATTTSSTAADSATPTLRTTTTKSILKESKPVTAAVAVKSNVEQDFPRGAPARTKLPKRVAAAEPALATTTEEKGLFKVSERMIGNLGGMRVQACKKRC